MAPVTIQTNAQGWREVSTTAYWSARVMWDTGAALYAVVQDTGATPKVRVLKADSRTAPSVWTEQDAANNKATQSVFNPFTSWYDANSGMIHVIVGTAAGITFTHYRFNTATDLWTTGFGNATTAGAGSRNVRCAVRSDGDVLVFFTSSADTADAGYFIWQGASWSPGSVNGLVSLNSTLGVTIIDAGIDATDRSWVVLTHVGNAAVRYLTINSANALTALVDIQPTSGAPASDTNYPAGGRYNVYDDAGTDKIIAATLSSGLLLQEREVTLESDAAAGNVATEINVELVAADVGTRTTISTAVLAGVPYCAWWDDANSGTIYYKTKSGGAWGSRTAFATGITRLIEIVPVSDGLAVVYQSGSDVVMDWIVAPSGGSTPVNDTDTISPTLSETDTLAAAIPQTETIAPTLSEADSVARTGSDADTIAPTLTELESVAVAVAEADTIAPTLTEVESVAVSVDKNDTDTIAPTLSESDSVATAISDAETLAPTLTEVENTAQTHSDTDTIAPALTEAETLTATLSDADTLAPTLSEAQTVAAAANDADTLSPTLTEVDGVFGALSDADTIAPTLTEAEALQATLAEAETLSPTLTEVDTVAVALADTDTITPTLSESDSVSLGVILKDDADTIAPTLAEVDTVAVSVSDADTISPTLTEVDAVTFAPTDTDTISPTLTEAQALTAAISQTETIAPVLGEGEIISAALADVETLAPVLIEGEATAQAKSDTDTIAPTLSESESVEIFDTDLPIFDADTIAPVFAILDTVTITASDADTIAPTLAETDAGAAALTDAETLAPILVELDALAAAIAETETLFVVLSETDSAAVFLAELETLTAFLSESGSVVISEFDFDQDDLIHAGRPGGVVYAGRLPIGIIAGGPDSAAALAAGRPFAEVDAGRPHNLSPIPGGRDEL